MIKAFIQRPAPIGLDIGRQSIRMLQLRSRGNAIVVSAAEQCRFPENTLGDANARREFAIEAVRDMLNTGVFHGREVVTCLCQDELVLKQIRLPHMASHELLGAIRWEAKERFGFPVAPEHLHHVMAGQVDQGSESREEIILLAASEEVVANHLSMLAEMKVRPVAIDAEPGGLFRSSERFLRRYADRDAATVLVSVNAEHTSVLVARGRQTAFIKYIAFGGRQLNEAVAETLGMDIGKAARLRREGAESASPAGPDAGSALSGREVLAKIREAVRRAVEDLGRELNLCLRYCAVTFRGLRPDRVDLLGDEAHDGCLRELLGGTLNVDCRAGEPLKGIDLSGAALTFDKRESFSEWALAVGLALKCLPAYLRARERVDARDRLSA